MPIVLILLALMPTLPPAAGRWASDMLKRVYAMRPALSRLPFSGSLPANTPRAPYCGARGVGCNNHRAWPAQERQSNMTERDTQVEVDELTLLQGELESLADQRVEEEDAQANALAELAGTHANEKVAMEKRQRRELADCKAAHKDAMKALAVKFNKLRWRLGTLMNQAALARARAAMDPPTEQAEGGQA